MKTKSRVYWKKIPPCELGLEERDVVRPLWSIVVNQELASASDSGDHRVPRFYSRSISSEGASRFHLLVPWQLPQTSTCGRTRFQEGRRIRQVN